MWELIAKDELGTITMKQKEELQKLLTKDIESETPKNHIELELNPNIKYQTENDKHKHNGQSFSKLIPEYGYQEQEINLPNNRTGKREVLVQVGQMNIYDLIQESLEESKIETQLNKYGPQPTNWEEQDISEIPTTLAQVQTQKIKNTETLAKLEETKNQRAKLETEIDTKLKANIEKETQEAKGEK